MAGYSDEDTSIEGHGAVEISPELKDQIKKKQKMSIIILKKA